MENRIGSSKTQEFIQLKPEEYKDIVSKRSQHYYNDNGTLLRQYPTQDGYILEDGRFYPHKIGTSSPMGNMGLSHKHSANVRDFHTLNSFERQLTRDFLASLTGIPARFWSNLSEEEINEINTLLDTLIPKLDEIHKKQEMRMYKNLPNVSITRT